MIKLLNYAEAKEKLLACRGNLRYFDFDKVVDCALDFFSSFDESVLVKGETYHYFKYDYAFWFQLVDVANVLVRKYRQRKEYLFKLTHVCKKDEALLVL